MTIYTFDSWIQTVCPAPRRHLQRLIVEQGLKTGLDIGCGVTSPLSPLRERGFQSTGLDISSESIREARRRDLHDKYIEGDFRSCELQSEYDVVTCCHVIEHLSREDGDLLLRRLEKMARYMVYIETPNGFREQVAEMVPQRHLSGWFPHDFASRGYTVFGSGIKGARGSYGAAQVVSESVTRCLERATQWSVFRRPAMAGTIGAVRFRDQHGNLRKV